MVDGPLAFLDLSNNKLKGQIPDCLWQFKNLHVLNLGYNKLYGRPPASIGSLVSLRELYLNNNNFHGKFPLSLKNCTNLGSLYLGANKFSGTVPFWIGKKLSSLYALSLTSNNFYGGIPLELCQLVELQILDLSINNLNGTIPTCLNNITAMVQDSPHVLQHATLYGPDAIMIHWKGDLRDFSDINLRFLKIIDLSRNNLTGKIPDELADLHALIELNLSMNALYGKIPSKIGHMQQLQSLDLSKNNLSGEIPLSMSQMNFLSYLDLSYNNLLGKIPSSTQLQSFEPSSFIGNARLCGLPLTKICPEEKENEKEIEIPLIIGKNKDDKEGIDDPQIWLYYGVGTGFAFGFWTICGGLLLYRPGKHALIYFMNRLERVFM